MLIGEWNVSSGVPIGVENSSRVATFLGGGCRDFDLLCRFDDSKLPACAPETFRMAVQSATSDDLAASPRPACARLGLRCVWLGPVRSNVRIPGPTDFRGALGTAEPDEGVAK